MNQYQIEVVKNHIPEELLSQVRVWSSENTGHCFIQVFVHGDNNPREILDQIDGILQSAQFIVKRHDLYYNPYLLIIYYNSHE